jgi:hypothetical protein
MTARQVSTLLSLFAVLVISDATSLALADGPGDQLNSFRKSVAPFFHRHCVDCHRGEKAEGDFELDRLDYDLSASSDVARQWQKVSHKLILGEMPPEDEPRPKQDELDAVIESVNTELQRAVKILRSKGGNEVVFRRLNKRQFNYTIHDLFGLEGDFASSFPDDAVEHGFNNIGSGLVLSASQLQAYVKIADVILDKAIVAGERPRTHTASFTLNDVNPEFRRLLRSKHDGDGVVVMRYGFPKLRGKIAPIDGKYRLRVTAYAVRNKGKYLRLEVQHGKFRNRSVVPPVDGRLEVVDDKPKTFEFVASLKRRDVFALYPPDLTNWMREEDVADYDGPGIAIKKIEFEGPLFDTWPPKSHRVIFGDSIKDNYSDKEVVEILRRFATSAFRRPAPEREVQAYFKLYQQARHDGDECLPALKHSLKAVLCSPRFLYLYEEPGKLDDFALASRLAYFLWCSIPDDELLRLAAQEQLSQPSVLKQQIARMIADPRIDRFVNDFVGQWLNVDQVGEMQPDTRLYPEYDTYLERSMREETQRFFREVLVENLSIGNFINSDFAMLNDRLAKHYGISGVEGGEIRRVKLPRDSHRGGLLTQASILTTTSNGTTTSPVVRGVWMLENILGQPSLPPPPISTDIEPDIRGASTIKEQLARHRTIAQCNVCHRKIDPYGLALESFDVVGGWREYYRKVKPGARPSSRKRFDLYVKGPKVESFADAPNFGEFDGFESFRKLLMKNKHLVVRCVTEKMMTYALGRGLDIADDDTIDSMVGDLKQQDHGLRTLLEQIILSHEFQTN